MDFSGHGKIVLAAGFALGLALPAAAEDRQIVIAYANEPTTVDPCDMEADPALVLHGNVVQTLTDIDPKTSDVTPLLATSWQQDGPKAWVFKLRDGVTYSDGAPFNAEAAAFGINRGMNTPEITCSDQAKVAAKIKVSVVDPMTVRLETQEPAPNLPRELAYLHLPSPKSTPAKEKTAKPVGTGPYTFVKWDSGEQIILQRRSDVSSPAVEKVTVKFRKEPSVRAQMVQTGEADIAYPIPPQFATTDDRTKEVPSSAVFLLRLSNTIAPLNDIRVREAVRAAIDKKTSVEVLLGRTGMVTDNAVASSINAYMQDYHAPGYDPDKARELLAAAKQDGVPVDKKIDLVAMTDQFTGSSEIMQNIAQNLQDVGLNVDLQVVDPAAWAKILFRRSTPTDRPIILAAKNGNTTGDGSPTFTSYMDKNGCCAATDDDQMAQLIEKARQQADPAARRDAWHQAAMYQYTKDLSILPIAELVGLMLISSRIDYQPTGQTEDMQLKLGDIRFK
jgi:peptide/nickel transport system substrate-binding protein